MHPFRLGKLEYANSMTVSYGHLPDDDASSRHLATHATELQPMDGISGRRFQFRVFLTATYACFTDFYRRFASDARLPLLSALCGFALFKVAPWCFCLAVELVMYAICTGWDECAMNRDVLLGPPALLSW